MDTYTNRKKRPICLDDCISLLKNIGMVYTGKNEWGNRSTTHKHKTFYNNRHMYKKQKLYEFSIEGYMASDGTPYCRWFSIAELRHIINSNESYFKTWNL